MFHAATAYLPSTFAMYTTMLGTAAFLDWRGGVRTAQGIFWFGVGAILGWPFAAVLVLPFMLEEFLIASLSNDIVAFIQRSLDGTVRSLIVLVIPNINIEKYRMLIYFQGPPNQHRRILLQGASLRSLEYRRVQHLRWKLKGAKHLRHRAMAFLHPKSPHQLLVPIGAHCAPNHLHPRLCAKAACFSPVFSTHPHRLRTALSLAGHFHFAAAQGRALHVSRLSSAGFQCRDFPSRCFANGRALEFKVVLPQSAPPC
jgi:hypothetical protein